MINLIHSLPDGAKLEMMAFIVLMVACLFLIAWKPGHEDWQD